MIQISDNDAANTRAIMDIAGGVLVFLAAVFTIVNDRLNRAKNVAARERVISGVFSIVATAFAIAGFIVSLVFGAGRASLCLFILAAVVTSIEYLRAAGPASRAETFQLVFFLACVVSLASLYEVEKLLGLIERMIGVLEKLTK